MDQWVRAPPHGFSQLATSFFACPRLGILRAPLLRLVSVQRMFPRKATLYHLRTLNLIRTSPNVFDQKKLGVPPDLGAR
jgi:hypothetical protein